MPQCVHGAIGLVTAIAFAGCAIPDGGYYSSVGEYQPAPEVVIAGGYEYGGPGDNGYRQHGWYGGSQHHNQYHESSTHFSGNHGAMQGHGHAQHGGGHNHK